MEKVISAVKQLLSKDDTGHGFEHVERVYNNAMKICDTEKMRIEKLLHLRLCCMIVMTINYSVMSALLI